jgi:hypothetical protein
MNDLSFATLTSSGGGRRLRPVKLNPGWVINFLNAAKYDHRLNLLFKEKIKGLPRKNSTYA